MKPVIIQTLFKKMKGRIRLPDPPSTDESPKHRDRTGNIILAVFVFAVIICFLL